MLLAAFVFLYKNASFAFRPVEKPVGAGCAKRPVSQYLLGLFPFSVGIRDDNFNQFCF
jgi:hypothetical protein